jgi:hypothetical protein
MKYLILFAGVAVVYFVLGRQSHVAPVIEAVSASEAAPLTTGPRATASTAAQETNSLKSPIDRTHAALEQVKARNGAGEF